VELLGFGEIEIATDIMGVRQDMAVEVSPMQVQARKPSHTNAFRW